MKDLIKEIRMTAGMNQEQFANTLGTTVSDSFADTMQYGMNRLNAETVNNDTAVSQIAAIQIAA